MNPQQELKLLKRLNKLLTNERTELKRKAIKRTAIYAVTWVALVVAFAFVMKGDGIGIVAVSIAALSGIFAGIAIYSGIAAMHWPLIRPRINDESIAVRIKHLET